jgi:hypothetical protein
MKISEFIKEVMKQINDACAEQGAQMPKCVEFTIQINAQGEVCKAGDIAVGTMKICV